MLICIWAAHIILILHTHTCTHPLGHFSPLLTRTPGIVNAFLSTPLPGCTLNRQDVRLTLHYEKGFTVTREPADPAGGAVLYRYPYEKLKMSADDGIRNLYLDFGGPEGEMVSYNYGKKTYCNILCSCQKANAKYVTQSHYSFSLSIIIMLWFFSLKITNHNSEFFHPKVMSSNCLESKLEPENVCYFNLINSWN